MNCFWTGKQNTEDGKLLSERGKRKRRISRKNADLK
jgi:hypothetical protein